MYWETAVNSTTAVVSDLRDREIDRDDFDIILL